MKSIIKAFLLSAVIGLVGAGAQAHKTAQVPSSSELSDHGGRGGGGGSDYDASNDTQCVKCYSIIHNNITKDELCVSCMDSLRKIILNDIQDIDFDVLLANALLENSDNELVGNNAFEESKGQD